MTARSPLSPSSPFVYVVLRSEGEGDLRWIADHGRVKSQRSAVKRFHLGRRKPGISKRKTDSRCNVERKEGERTEHRRWGIRAHHNIMYCCCVNPSASRGIIGEVRVPRRIRCAFRRTEIVCLRYRYHIHSRTDTKQVPDTWYT